MVTRLEGWGRKLDEGEDSESSSARQFLWRVLRFCRYSFAFRAALTMTLGTLMSCGNCTTCIAYAAYIGCNACNESGQGCNSDDSEDDDPVPDTETLCEDGLDDDRDGEVDCEDSDCRFAGLCGEYICYDGRDDDGDGAIDCDDSDCCHLEQCRCHCAAQCEEGTALCVNPDDACDFDCCAAGESCVDGRCSPCEIECTLGYEPCWTGGALCDHLCCTPGQGCGSGACGCVAECESGGHPCITDEWSCAFECCQDGDVCRSGGCSPYTCTGVIQVEERLYELNLEWGELEDTIDVTGLDGCSESTGAEVLLQVELPPGEALLVHLESGRLQGAHVLDACPPTACASSPRGAPESTTLWLNDSDEAEQILVLLEGDGPPALGHLETTRFTGEACSVALTASVPTDGYGWTADSALFESWGEGGLCGVPSQRRVWFEVEVEAGQRLEASAWANGLDFTPSIVIVSGDCAEPTCLVVGDEAVAVRNDLETAQLLVVAVGWDSQLDGELNVDFRVEE